MRLIDADVFKENLDKEFETATDAHDAVDFALEDTPTIEAEPVVRCRECKYRRKDGCPIIDANIWMDDEDFCSHGERKEGADRC